MTASLLDVDAALCGLKDFQRRTVEYVFDRMYGGPAKRFLVADEVGLGKTLVARGIIAKAVEHLQRKGVERVDVLYICSNATIAQQNLNRLNVTDQATSSFATRLTLLPLQLQSLKSNGINFISFTPGTTFDLRSRGGKVEERALIYRMLHGRFGIRSTPLFNLLQAKMSRDRWLRWARHYELDYDESLADAFRKNISRDGKFLKELLAVCENFRRVKRIRGDLVEDRYRMIGELRRRLADVCIDALDPDLVILDEFQRFKDLLTGQDEAAELAQQLFRHPEVRVLLLSATPYRMLSLNHETEDDHYGDFMETLRFLFDGDEARVAGIRDEFRRFRQALYGLDESDAARASAAKDALERQLRTVIARTERIDVARSQNAMMVERSDRAVLKPSDLRAARFVDTVARCVGAGDTVDYWKSSPYLVNFMGDYELKRRLLENCRKPPADLHEAFRGADGELLRNVNVQRYRSTDPGNARLRQLLADTVHAGQWQLLWLPPSLPYMRPGGVYAQEIPATKALIFSSWQVVPDAIAAVCSYEAERLMLQDQAGLPRYHELHKKRRQLLQFRIDPQDKRPAGMPALALIYPCTTLANLVDPLQLALAAAARGSAPEVAAVRDTARRRIAEKLAGAKLISSAADGVADQRWYWASLALLDNAYAEETVSWVRDEATGWLSSYSTEDGDGTSGFREHLTHFVEAADGRLKLGRMPDDLLDVLTDCALGSPAVCAMRAMRRIAPDLPDVSTAMLTAASRVANGLRTLFNQPEVTGFLRADDERMAYWRRVLGYCIDGNLQAVLDEYAHVLKENTGLSLRPGAEIAAGMSEAMIEALSLRTSSLRVDDLKATPQGDIRVKEFSVRCKFAVRFGDVRDDDGQTLVRSGSVRQAFNSPFRPFVLASTSVGQEGLDFHPYCHAIYHWNLPTNPVDLEQREGRVHRYKGHAVRRNVAKAIGLGALLDGQWHDPWEGLFAKAAETRGPGTSELVPYWLFETEGGWNVERRVPLLPLSREVSQLKRLKHMLAVYRLAFGQPRQEDFLEYVGKTAATDSRQGLAAQYRISLAPR